VGGSPPNEYVATTSDTPDASHRASLRRIGFLCDESHFHATYETLFPRRRLNCLRNLRLRRTHISRESHPRCDISSNRETYRRSLRRMKSQSVALPYFSRREWQPVPPTYGMGVRQSEDQ
jgi:hypothetical protein